MTFHIFFKTWNNVWKFWHSLIQLHYYNDYDYKSSVFLKHSFLIMTWQVLLYCVPYFNYLTKFAIKHWFIPFIIIIPCKLNYKHKILWVEVYWSVSGKLLTSKLILAFRQADLNIQAQFLCPKIIFISLMHIITYRYEFTKIAVIF